MTVEEVDRVFGQPPLVTGSPIVHTTISDDKTVDGFSIGKSTSTRMPSTN